MNTKNLYYIALFLWLFTLSGLVYSSDDNFTSLPQEENYKTGTLYITWMGVIDNGEGDNCPHGPWGNLYVVVYLGDNDCPYYGKEISRFEGYHRKRVIEGPSSGKCPIGLYASDEWIDGDAMRMKLPIHNWSSSQKDEQITVYIYESDTKNIGRPTSHDLLYCGTIWKSNTLNNHLLSWSNRTPGRDAVRMAKKRGAQSWLKEVWSKGLTYSTPSIFIQFLSE